MPLGMARTVRFRNCRNRCFTRGTYASHRDLRYALTSAHVRVARFPQLDHVDESLVEALS
jgi:hypothetical protein